MNEIGANSRSTCYDPQSLVLNRVESLSVVDKATEMYSKFGLTVPSKLEYHRKPRMGLPFCLGDMERPSLSLVKYHPVICHLIPFSELSVAHLDSASLHL